MLAPAIVTYMADRVEVSATPDRLLTVIGRPADDDGLVLLDILMMLVDALFARHRAAFRAGERPTTSSATLATMPAQRHADRRHNQGRGGVP
jgi:hypothetical protein